MCSAKQPADSAWKSASVTRRCRCARRRSCRFTTTSASEAAATRRFTLSRQVGYCCAARCHRARSSTTQPIGAPAKPTGRGVTRFGSGRIGRLGFALAPPFGGGLSADQAPVTNFHISGTAICCPSITQGTTRDSVRMAEFIDRKRARLFGCLCSHIHLRRCWTKVYMSFARLS